MPADLHEPLDLETALRWTGRRLPLLAAGVMALLGLALVTGPMIAADLLTSARPVGRESRASRHLYVGLALVLAWWAALASLAGALRGPLAALVVLLFLPILGLTGLAVQQGWSVRLHQARRWILLRTASRWRRTALAEQAELGAALDELLSRPPAGAEPLVARER